MSDVREVLREADRLRNRVEALESIARGIRLGRQPLRLRDRIFVRREHGGSEEQLTRQETSELYRWCNEKIRELEVEAARLESTVEVKP